MDRKLVSELLGISEKSYYRWKDERKIFAFLEKYFTNDEIREFLESGSISRLEKDNNHTKWFFEKNLNKDDIEFEQRNKDSKDKDFKEIFIKGFGLNENEYLKLSKEPKSYVCLLKEILSPHDLVEYIEFGSIPYKFQMMSMYAEYTRVLYDKVEDELLIGWWTFLDKIVYEYANYIDTLKIEVTKESFISYLYENCNSIYNDNFKYNVAYFVEDREDSKPIFTEQELFANIVTFLGKISHSEFKLLVILSGLYTLEFDEFIKL